MQNVLRETFIKNFFANGHNLFAILWQEKDMFYIQLGCKTFKYKKYENALFKYEEYISRAKAQRSDEVANQIKEKYKNVKN